MVGKTNVAGSRLFAAVGVTYPEGSTCECSKGTKKLKAKNTSGQWVFALPSAGTYTITASDGTNSKSQTVEITAEGQFERVTLNYRFTLYSQGDQAESITGGWEVRPAASASNHTVSITGAIAFESDRMRYTDSKQYGAGLIVSKQKVDLTDVDTLQFTYCGERYRIDGYGSWFGVWLEDSKVNKAFPPSNASAYKKLITTSEQYTDTLDVSGLDGEYYVGFGVSCWVTNGIEFNVYDVGEVVA